MSTNPFYTLLDTTAREAQRFASMLFRQIDSRESVPQPITPGTTIVWNGTPLVGPEAFNEMIGRSPIMVHDINGLDVQPFPNGDQNAINMLINTSGSVKLANDYFGFSAQLIVRRTQAGAPLILQTMAYRLVHKPAKTTLQI